MNNKILVTGVTSGLGKYLHRELDCVGLDRTNFDEVKDGDYDVIVHCTFNNSKYAGAGGNSSQIGRHKVVDDNIILTSELTKLDCRRFLYISSIDVYNYTETSLYNSTKRIAEQIVALLPTSLSLRCSFLVGPDMRSNHLVKLFTNAEKIGLSGKSTFNYVMYSDVLRFIQKEQYRTDDMYLDFTSNSNITLDEVKEMLGSITELGTYTYTTYTAGWTHPPIYELDKFYDKSSKYNIENYFTEKLNV